MRLPVAAPPLCGVLSKNAVIRPPPNEADAERHAVRIREPEQHAQAVLPSADAAVGETAGDIHMIDSMYIKVHAAALRISAVQGGRNSKLHLIVAEHWLAVSDTTRILAKPPSLW
uniref:hypothetical protein n=1 Tax=Treponema endosymbiont of Eucomonympha sp. TaxID=1580831 RepID=UPI000ADF418F